MSITLNSACWHFKEVAVPIFNPVKQNPCKPIISWIYGEADRMDNYLMSCMRPEDPSMIKYLVNEMEIDQSKSFMSVGEGGVFKTV
jgi:hypothetical protein